MRSTKQQKSQLQIALLGMDERSCKIMSMFFKGPCEGHAVVVDENRANIAIIDTRFEHAKELLEQSLAQGKMRAIIVLSSQSVDRIDHEKIMYLDKPITANPMFEALDWAKDISEGKQREKPNALLLTKTKTDSAQQAESDNASAAPETTDSAQVTEAVAEAASEPSETAVAQEPPEPKPVTKPTASTPENRYPATLQVEESEFSEVIGTVVDIDWDDLAKQRTAIYDPDKYYQGYIQQTFKRAVEENAVLQLTLGWNPLVIFPQTNQIWWDADDKLLKAVSDIEINAKSSVVTVLDPNEINMSELAPEKMQDMEAFLWKLTLWSSRGRYPQSIEIDSPIQLKRWPNFTRHIITPHALRIAALLIKEGPDTMIGVANVLNIELRYVSIFVSAAHALGLIRQVPQPKIDEVVSSVTPRNKTDKQKRSILNKILNKLLGR